MDAEDQARYNAHLLNTIATTASIIRELAHLVCDNANTGADNKRLFLALGDLSCMAEKLDDAKKEIRWAMEILDRTDTVPLMEL